MRILPRVKIPTPKAARRLWRKTKGHLSLRRIYYSVEVALFLAIFLFIFSGSRLKTIDAFGHRMDAVVSLILIAAFIVIHIIARRRLLIRIERHYAPSPYDERKIFFDLGQGTRDVTSVDQLYQILAEK